MEGTIELFCTIYKLRYKLKLSNTEMAKYFEINPRSMRNRLKLMEWQYDRYEAQQKAAKEVRDYSKIVMSKKKRMLQILKGSNKEDYVRHKLNLELSDILFDCDVIVGVNNISILKPKESDIPIIIIENDNIHKYVIELNGDYWHKDKEEIDKEKKILLKNKGYKYFDIWHFGNTRKQKEFGEIDFQIEDIMHKIKKDIELNN